MKHHKNIAVFIPHLGCPHTCVFCSQQKITGADPVGADIGRELEATRKIIEEQLPTLNGTDTEIAFFGGSFTGIGEERMTALLALASSYIGGCVTGIRCSTRPDYVNKDICETLKRYGVTAVELGIQSTNDRVLEASERGHDTETSKRACSLIKQYGFELGGQMMVGMPESTAADEIKTAADIVSFGADTCRIYPMVVFEGTSLYEKTLRGEYIPLGIHEAAERSAACARIFIENGVTVLRIGLHASENLVSAPFGANHPAMGELAEGEIYYGIMRDMLANQAITGDVTFLIPSGALSKCIGQKGANRERLRAVTGGAVRFEESAELPQYSVRLKA